ncbi:MAG: Coq4 family protein [Leptolyngbyaceae cyanobacterium]
MRPRYLLKAVHHALMGNAGDVAAYKAAALATSGYGDLDSRLAALESPLPAMTLDELLSRPAGSFGYVLARFFQNNHIQPLTLSDDTRTELQNSPVLAIRYPLFHDAFHVLLGFDTSLAGELGVWSFVAAQRYSPAFDRAAFVGRWVTRLVIPWQWKRLKDFEMKGRELGERAVCVIAEPLEEFWDLSLEEVRIRLELPVEV